MKPTAKQQKEAYRHAIENSVDHLVDELKGKIQRGVKEDGNRIIPELLKAELENAKSEFDNLEPSIKSHALSGGMAYRYINREAHDRIMNAKDKTYHNIFKWIDSDSKPELDKVFKGRVLFKYIKYLKGELSKKSTNNQPEHLEATIDTAIDWAITNINDKLKAKEVLRVYANAIQDNPKRSANNIFEEEIEDRYSVAKATFYEWVPKYVNALKKLTHAQDI